MGHLRHGRLAHHGGVSLHRVHQALEPRRKVIDLLAGVPPALHLEEPIRRLLGEWQALAYVLVDQLGESVVPGHGDVSPTRRTGARGRWSARYLRAGTACEGIPMPRPRGPAARRLASPRW